MKVSTISAVIKNIARVFRSTANVSLYVWLLFEGTLANMLSPPRMNAVEFTRVVNEGNEEHTLSDNKAPYITVLAAGIDFNMPVGNCEVLAGKVGRKKSRNRIRHHSSTT